MNPLDKPLFRSRRKRRHHMMTGAELIRQLQAVLSQAHLDDTTVFNDTEQPLIGIEYNMTAAMPYITLRFDQGHYD